MVTRRLRKGSVYDALSSSSGLDFSPVVPVKSLNSRKDVSNPQAAMEEEPKKATACSSFSKMNPPPESDNDKCLTSHEKYPSWPVVDSESTTVPYRSHSWTGQTDYPKEKVGYSRPQKTRQYKISTNQLQPVLERGNSVDLPERRKSESYRTVKFSHSGDGINQQFDFEAFHTPCIPHCYSEAPERDNTSREEANGFLRRYEDVLRHQVQYPVPKSKASTPDTPFLDRLRMEHSWPRSDCEISSENGTWMDSMESSSHGRVAKWQGSYSDLSTLSTQLSNRSSLFDSGHSTMPESGRLSPQSSCDSLLLEGPTRAHVVARHGCHREIVAHSARVQQPERYGSESVLYYAVLPAKKGNGTSPEEAVYRSHASLTLGSPRDLEISSPSRISSNSFSSEDSFTRPRYVVGDDTSGSSSDVSNVTCISNSKGGKISPNKDKKIDGESLLSKGVDENIKNLHLPEVNKRQRISDPDLKAIQKQAVMSFYQRMSLAESLKGENTEPPPPYDGPSPYFSQQPTNHSKSVPNLVALKGKLKTQRAPLVKDVIIPWDHLREKKAVDKVASSSENKDLVEDCGSGLQHLKGLRKVHLKENHHSNEVQVLTPEGVTLSAKRRPAPPPPPKQPPRRPPPPPPPQTPDKQVIVHLNDHNQNDKCKASEKNEDTTEPLLKNTDNTLIYPKNSYMSYRSERKLSRQGFDGKYRRLSSDSTNVELVRKHNASFIIQPDTEKSTSETPLQSPSQDTVVINCPLDNEVSEDARLDLNQNSVKSDVEVNGTYWKNRINNVSRLYRKNEKTEEELECERLSYDFVQLHGDVALKRLLVPSPNQKTMYDYVRGLINIELDQNCSDNSVEISAFKSQITDDSQRDDRRPISEKINSFVHGDVANKTLELNENQTIENDIEKRKKQEEVIASVGKKIESLKAVQSNIRTEMAQNELLGQEIAAHLRELAKSNELEKFTLHVEETEKIVNLLLSLSGRLAKAENVLKDIPNDCSTEEKRIFEAKRDKLKEQHEDACRLKENIDRRSCQVTLSLKKYFSESEYACYDFFIKMKTKLIIDVREIDDRINLGEEQLAALNVVSHLWKSTNS